MANYFSIFPKVIYSFDEYKTSEFVSDITARFSFEEELKENSAVFFKYAIHDEDTPEIIASKYYNSPNKHWLVLMMNNIIDPQYDWPLDYNSLNSYIDLKYLPSANSNTSGDGIAWSQSNIKSYYTIEKVTNPNNNIVSTSYEVDANTYANTAYSNDVILLEDGNTITIEIDKFTKSYYDYELEENEKKREIKLLRKDFLPAIEKELQRIFL